MVIVPGPVEFLMGSPPTEAGRRPNEPQHTTPIGRSFAIAAKSLTVEQYRQFNKEYSLPEQFTRTADLPAVNVTWFEAAAYCNWLSKVEGIGPDQWCYEITERETKPKANYLSLTGYRLPTEAEMEYAMRAGANTARYFGESDEFLAKYAWYKQNSNGKNTQPVTWPVGRLRPNDFGLFDALGNVWTWCQESLEDYRPGTLGEARIDAEDKLLLDGNTNRAKRVVRGSAYAEVDSWQRSAFRGNALPTSRWPTISIRPARSLPINSSNVVPEGGKK
jgi:formylglycine-generating enzyme required for sulfatase activity